MTKSPLDLLKGQSVEAEVSIFSGEKFPTIDFVNSDLIKAALGSYDLTIRYFDGAWNEVRTAIIPGRYGAWVDIRFSSGLSDGRQVTLFKTEGAYHPVLNPHQVLIEFPAAFGLSKDVVSQERWNANDLGNQMLTGKLGAALVAALHDIQNDPAKWRGFNCWQVQGCWWTTLREKMNLSPDYQYLISLPKEYETTPGHRWPLIMFLHGSYECGDDLDLLRSQGPLGHVNRGHALPCIVVSPQCRLRNGWSTEKLMRLIENIESLYQVDSDRIYLTGLSMGGFSTFDLAACYPEKFAAIAVLSAGENPEIAARLKTVPVWMFHGTDDRVVSSQQSVEIAERLEKLGGEVKLSLLPEVGHGGWDAIYSGTKIYDWLFRHSRAGPQVTRLPESRDSQ